VGDLYDANKINKVFRGVLKSNVIFYSITAATSKPDVRSAVVPANFNIAD